MTNVPFIQLKPTAQRLRASVLPAWERAYDACEFVGGPSVARLEAELAARLHVKNALACANGTDAILIALQAGGVGPGTRVAMPNLTFWATYEAAAQLGATPVLIDTDETLQMSYAEFTAAWEKHRFEAAVLVHLMGWATPELARFRAFCRERKILLVEDGAQSFGVEVAGRPVFAGAQISTLSFYPAKVIGGCMDGGAILTDDPVLAATAKTLCNHGRAAHYSYSHVGWNSRMGGMQAIYLLEFLAAFDEILADRRRTEARYLEAAAGWSGVTVHRAPDGVRGNAYLSVLTCPDPAALADRL